MDLFICTSEIIFYLSRYITMYFFMNSISIWEVGKHMVKRCFPIKYGIVFTVSMFIHFLVDFIGRILCKRLQLDNDLSFKQKIIRFFRIFPRNRSAHIHGIDLFNMWQ